MPGSVPGQLGVQPKDSPLPARTADHFAETYSHTSVFVVTAHTADSVARWVGAPDSGWAHPPDNDPPVSLSQNKFWERNSFVTLPNEMRRREGTQTASYRSPPVPAGNQAPGARSRLIHEAMRTKWRSTLFPYKWDPTLQISA